MSSHSLGYENKIVAQNYSKYRPTYNFELYNKIIEYVEHGADEKGRRSLAVDIGCGCGKSTTSLARYFVKVIGIDSSEVQLNEARTVSVEYPNVEYRLGSAEDLSSILKDETVDLVTVGSALHLFDFVPFYQECVRVLKPGGVVSVYTHKLPQCEKLEANESINKIFHDTRCLSNYLPKGAYHIFNDFLEPFALMKQYLSECVRMEATILRYKYSLSVLMGLLKSFPEYHAYKVDHPEDEDSINEILQELKDILEVNSFDDKFGLVLYNIPLFMGRKISNHLPGILK